MRQTNLLKALLNTTIAVIVLGTVWVPQTVMASETAETEYETKVMSDFSLSDIADAAEMLNKGLFTSSATEGVSMEYNEEAGGVMITADAELLRDTKFSFGEEFDFAGNVEHFVFFDALAQRKTQVYLVVEDPEHDLEHAEESGTENGIMLPKQINDKIWTTSDKRIIRISNKNGKGVFQFQLIPDDSVEGEVSVVIRSMALLGFDNPTMIFDIDESQGTIDAMNNDMNHNTECYGTVTISIPDGYVGEYTDAPMETQTYELDYIRGRGNTTWGQKKKPYKIKLDKKADLFGMGKNKNWALIANRFDSTMLRNKFTYWLGEEIGMEFTPQSECVNVIMNGRYLGSYYLSEQIRVDEGRIEIDDLEDNDESRMAEDEETISGGYLLGYAGWGASVGEHVKHIDTEHGLNLIIESPSFEGYENEAQLNYISNYVQKTEDAIFGEDFKDENGISYEEYLDVDSLIDYVLIQEFSLNDDGFKTGSNYLYKKRNGKLYWGPLWDFDYVAWGSMQYDFHKTTGFMHRCKWFNQLVQDPVFYEKVQIRWTELRELLLNAVEAGGAIDWYSDRQYQSQKFNYYIWPVGGADVDVVNEPEIPEGATRFEDFAWNYGFTYEDEIQRFKNWIRERVAWVDENFEDIKESGATIRFLVDDQEYAVGHANESFVIEDWPEDPEKENMYFQGWFIAKEIMGEEFGDGEVLPSRFVDTSLVVRAKWGTEPIVTAENVQFLMDDYYVKPGDYMRFICGVYPFNAVTKGIFYESADSDIAYMQPEGDLQAGEVGETVITVSAPNGEKAVCTIHVTESAELPEKIAFSEESYRLKVGEIQKLSIQTEIKFPCINTCQLYSSNKEVVKINDAGLMEAVGEGKAIIIAIPNETADAMAVCSVEVSF